MCYTIPNMTKTVEKMLTVKDVAALLQVTPQTVWKMVDARRLKPVRFNSRVVRFDPEDVQALIDQSKVHQ